MNLLEIVVLNLFLANVAILYPLKTPESIWVSVVFSGYKMGTLTRYELHKFSFTSVVLPYLHSFH